ncbi:MAG TPA: hypothetical protein PKO41_04020 [Dokdonella sp.]|uniref:DUF6607 family protein n=1 Tax=Dokdonella sp. TaxID=2291710 RepID=UPI0025BAF69F|nr:DUF6607 family protein [Dokdonella sp.]MBX3691219.1 hypothetical protein [Dokdonella sp.]MCW5567224.1 hypothetical protein [Dokdonella sp.]HNR91575.1 hypothetical protein [Dokdonella sp.]
MTSRPLITPFVLVSLFMLAGCASAPRSKSTAAAPKPLAEAAPAQYTSPCPKPPTNAEERFECDRRSILAMAGEFRVRFIFDETAALAPGYTPHPAQRSGATELVEVVEDTGRKIVLQHILVMKMGEDVHVIKHWRQDWHYEPADLLRYRGRSRFEHEAVDANAARGAWAQVVYEVDDAPRYSGIGHWTHSDGVDAWMSDLSLRPLPRREHSKRRDYQAIEAYNRHTLTPGGWVHEQDNTKLVIDVDGKRHAIARERGINSYTRITDFDFNPGREYWEKTKAYWASVRDAWARGAAAKASFELEPDPDDEPRINELFGQAERARKGETVPVAEIEDVLIHYGLPLTPPEGGSVY